MRVKAAVIISLVILVSVAFAGYNEKEQGHVSVLTSLDVLKGKTTTDLRIQVPEDVGIAKKVQVKAYYPNGTHKFTRNFFDIPSSSGIVQLQFNDLERQDRVDVLLMSENSSLEASGVVLLRPDLVVSSVNAAEKVAIGEPLLVSVSILEKNSDLGAKAVVELLYGNSVLASQDVSVEKGSAADVLLSTIFETRGEYNLSIRITNSQPVEYDEENNLYSFAVKVIVPDLVVSQMSSPAQVNVGEKFEAQAIITEQSGEAGATATVELLENSTVLDSKGVTLQAWGTESLALSTVFRTRGMHNLSIRITSSSPPEFDETNNVYVFEVRSIAPELTITSVNAPATAAIGEKFEVLASLSELYGEVGANATVALLENATSLDSKLIFIPAGGKSTVYLNGTLATEGSHNVSVRIISSIPQDDFAGNNEQSFVIVTNKSSEPLLFTSSYYYRITSLTSNRSFTDSGYEERGEDSDLREEEVLSFSATSISSLNFPLRVLISITNESGEGIIYEENAAVPTLIEGSRKTYVKYYNDSNVLLTLHIDESGTSLSIESKANHSLQSSSGYQHWWFKPAKEWNIATDVSSGKLIAAKQSLQARVEIESSSKLLGSNALIGIVNESYTSEWLDNSAGNFMEWKSVWIYKSGEILP